MAVQLIWIILCLEIKELYTLYVHTFFVELEFFCLLIYNIKYSYSIQIICKDSISLIDRTLTGTITLGLSGPGSNGNEKVLYTLQISRTGDSPSDAV